MISIYQNRFRFRKVANSFDWDLLVGTFSISNLMLTDLHDFDKRFGRQFVQKCQNIRFMG